MTKKDYELIAKTIAKLHKEQIERVRLIPSGHEQEFRAYGQIRALEQVATELSAEFRENNPKYSAMKFMALAINNNY